MDKQQATLLLDQYMQSDSARDLSFRQSDAVVGVLMTTFIDSEDVDVSDVAQISTAQRAGFVRQGLCLHRAILLRAMSPTQHFPLIWR